MHGSAASVLGHGCRHQKHAPPTSLAGLTANQLEVFPDQLSRIAAASQASEKGELLSKGRSHLIKQVEVYYYYILLLVLSD